MNKLTKVGCSALCGSLAAISSANAGDLTVTGGVDMTFMSHSGQATGNPIGIGSNYTFNGSGELDNGWTFGLTIAEANGSAWSAAVINLDMGGLGALNFNHGDSSNGIQAMDNKMPTAWEEAHGAGLSGGVMLVAGSGKSMNVMYTTPKVLGTTITWTWAPEYGVVDTADKTAGVNNTAYDDSMDVTVNINPSMGTEFLSGLNLFVGASEVKTYGNSAFEHNRYEGVAGVTFDIGPVALGAMASGIYTGEDSAADYNGYKNSAYGVAFNVSDDFSVSYGKYETRKASYNDSDVPGGPGQRNVEVTSWQAAYTMGGASIRVADVKADNVLFSDGDNQTATIVSLSLAF